MRSLLISDKGDRPWFHIAMRLQHRCLHNGLSSSMIGAILVRRVAPISAQIRVPFVDIGPAA
jgi:hypothetical protein